MQHNRNLCIIAHIDHGKSTLADRFIEHANLVDPRNAKPQMLDSMDLERERGITIKSRAITVPYKEININFIDTPGHADFSYEVSRAIASCEGALLIVDASQGVQAQTLANLYQAIEYDLVIIPVINKIDLPNADIESTIEQINTHIGIDESSCIAVSAKNNQNIDTVLDAIIERIPAPHANTTLPLKTRLFDSEYDPYRGIVLSIRVVEGIMSIGDRISGWQTSNDYKVEELGYFGMERIPTKELVAGQIGYCIANIKSISDIKVGDTIINIESPPQKPLEGFRTITPMVYASIFPLNSGNEKNKLRDAVEKLQLNDSSFVYEPEQSEVMGNGFRCGFLGLLHLDIIQERLEREFDLSVITTRPSVPYKICYANGDTEYIKSTNQYPDPATNFSIFEPFTRAIIIAPVSHVGAIIQLCIQKRGAQKSLIYIDNKRVELVFEIPLSELISEFFDTLKSISSGYASCDYELIDYRLVKLVKVDIIVNQYTVEALSFFSHASSAERKSRETCKILKEKIPQHQFAIAIQAAIGSRIIVRETVRAYRKDVTAKLYGGDITRKKKLLEKQKKGKKRLKLVGNVEIPREAFLSSAMSSSPSTKH